MAVGRGAPGVARLRHPSTAWRWCASAGGFARAAGTGDFHSCRCPTHYVRWRMYTAYGDDRRCRAPTTSCDTRVGRAKAMIESLIKAQAYGLGFDLVGIARLGPAETAPRVRRMARARPRGEMEYIRAHRGKASATRGCRSTASERDRRRNELWRTRAVRSGRALRARRGLSRRACSSAFVCCTLDRTDVGGASPARRTSTPARSWNVTSRGAPGSAGSARTRC